MPEQERAVKVKARIMLLLGGRAGEGVQEWALDQYSSAPTVNMLSG